MGNRKRITQVKLNNIKVPPLLVPIEMLGFFLVVSKNFCEFWDGKSVLELLVKGCMTIPVKYYSQDRDER